MCTAIVEIARVTGSAKGRDGWFGVSHAVVTYDHPTHLQREDAVLIDLVDRARGPDARVAVELSLESARDLRAALDRVIADAEREESEVRGPSRLAAE